MPAINSSSLPAGSSYGVCRFKLSRAIMRPHSPDGADCRTGEAPVQDAREAPFSAQRASSTAPHSWAERASAVPRPPDMTLLRYSLMVSSRLPAPPASRLDQSEVSSRLANQIRRRVGFGRPPTYGNPIGLASDTSIQIFPADGFKIVEAHRRRCKSWLSSLPLFVGCAFRMPSEALAHRDFFLTATLVVYRAAAKTLPFIAQMTACVRFDTPNFRIIWRTCTLTVASDMPS